MGFSTGGYYVGVTNSDSFRHKETCLAERKIKRLQPLSSLGLYIYMSHKRTTPPQNRTNQGLKMLLTKEECIGVPDRWQANAERLKKEKAARPALSVPKICSKMLRRIEKQEAKRAAEPEYVEQEVDTSGAISNPFYQADFLDNPSTTHPYLNSEHRNFDDTLRGLVRSIHANKTLDEAPKDALNMRSVYALYRQLPCFTVELIMNELWISKRQAYEYLKMIKMANMMLTLTTDNTMPIVPDYSDRDTKNYSRYKSKNKGEYFSKKIWWLITKRYAA